MARTSASIFSGSNDAGTTSTIGIALTFGYSIPASMAIFTVPSRSIISVAHRIGTLASIAGRSKPGSISRIIFGASAPFWLMTTSWSGVGWQAVSSSGMSTNATAHIKQIRFIWISHLVQCKMRHEDTRKRLPNSSMFHIHYARQCAMKSTYIS